MLREESYYNNKWKKAPIVYSGRTLKTSNNRIGIDVKTFVTTNDEILKEIITKYRLKKSSHDQTAHAIQKWVVRYLTYKYDSESSNCPEFWQFPFETVQSQIGDCEDGAILIASLCINAGIPPFRVKIAAGYVQSAPTAPQGGHAYAIYLADDGNWRILDWCYYEDSRTPVNRKPLAKNGGYRNCYKDVWFTFNSDYSWNQKSLDINGRLTKDGESEVLTESKIESIMKDVEDKYNE